MNEQAAKIQVVINTLGAMQIPGTFDNANMLLGIHRLLRQIMDELNGNVEVPEDAGNTDAE